MPVPPRQAWPPDKGYRLCMLPLLAVIAALSYGIESVFGFGGTVVFLGISGFVFDFKSVLHIAMVISAVSSTTILAQTWRHIDWRHYARVGLVTLPFVIAGTWVIGMVEGLWLLKSFALLLVAFGMQGLLLPRFQPHRILAWLFVCLGGFIQGVFTTGGPFILMGYRRFFAHKTELKATMAAFFLSANLWRIGQVLLDASVPPAALAQALWLAPAVMLGVWLGHHVHLRLSEQAFQRGLLLCMTVAGTLLLIK